MSALRQQTMPKDVIGVNITYGGLAPNIIHAYAAAGVVVRSEDRYRLVELERVSRMAVKDFRTYIILSASAWMSGGRCSRLRR